MSSVKKIQLKTSQPQEHFFDVVYIIDQTSSMGSQIEAVKSAVKNNISYFMENEEYTGLIQFSVLPYTESNNESYASFHSFKDGSEALSFVNNLRLSCPPSKPSESYAYGGDGPENVKAALSVLAQNVTDTPMLVFFITDAGWHYLKGGCGSSRGTTEAERKFLRQHSPNLPNHDMWTIWNSIPKGAFFFNPVLFLSYGQQFLHSYAQMAKQTNGIMVNIGNNMPNIQQIANHMTNVVKSIVSMLEGNDENPPPTSVPGFNVYDYSNVEFQETEDSPQVGKPVSLTSPEVVEKFLDTCITQYATVIEGKGWRKRTISLNARALHLQTRLYGMLLHYFSGKTSGEEAKKAIQTVMETTREEMPEDQKGHFSVTMEKIESIRSSLAESGVPEGFVDNVSMMTVKEIAEDTEIDEIYDDFVSVVCATLLGYMINIQFPVDASGKIDFMSAWDARVDNVGVAMMAIDTYLTLMSTEGSGEVTDPVTREKFNAMTVVSGKPGTLQNAMYRLASMMQVGNFAACYGVNADVRKGFIPNLAPGVLCGTFKWLVHQGMTDSIYDRARNVMYTFLALDKTPAQAVLAQLKKGQANPEDTVFKMFMLWYRELKGTEMGMTSLMEILTEWLQGLVQMKFGRRTEENNLRYNETLTEMFGFGGMGNFGDLDVLSPLEQEYNENTQRTIMDFLNSPEIQTKLVSHDIVNEFKKCISNTWTLLHANLDNGLPELVDFNSVFPNVGMAFADCFFRRLRKFRYDIVRNSDDPKDYTHVLKEELTSTPRMLFDNLLNIHNSTIRDREAQRVANAKALLVKIVVDKFAEESNSDPNDALDWNDYLSRLVAFTSTKTKVVLSRKDLATQSELYETKNISFMQVLVNGSWSSDVPQALRSVRNEMMSFMGKCYEQIEIMELLGPISSALVCKRTKGCNRHGHSANEDNPCLSVIPVQFTEEYATTRLEYKNTSRISNYLNKMREFKKQIDNFIEQNYDNNLVNSIAYQYQDANLLEHFKNKVEKTVSVE